MKLFRALALAGLVSCGLAAPVMAAPATIIEEVAAFDKPTQDGRLAVLKGLLDARGLTYEVRPFNSGRPGAPEGYNVVVILAAGGEKDGTDADHGREPQVRAGSNAARRMSSTFLPSTRVSCRSSSTFEESASSAARASAMARSMVAKDRRMTAAVGHPTLRLVRARIGGLTLAGLGLAPGAWRTVARADVLALPGA